MEEESRYWRETEDVITLMDNEQDAPHKYEEQPKYSLTSFSQVLSICNTFFQKAWNFL